MYLHYVLRITILYIDHDLSTCCSYAPRGEWWVGSRIGKEVPTGEWQVPNSQIKNCNQLRPMPVLEYVAMAKLDHFEF